jgi:replicative DNA helicase
MSTTNSRAPYVPIDAEAERAVLQAILTSPEAFYDANEHLIASDFGIEAHAYIYAAMCAVESAGRPIDVITVTDELRRQRSLAKAGGAGALSELEASAGAVVNLDAHRDIVEEKSLLRRLVVAGRGISGGALQPDADAAAVLETAEQAVFELGARRSSSSLVSMTQAVAATMKELGKVRTKLLLGHSTGLADLDRMTGGLQPGQLFIVAARPGIGKSAFALQIARHVAESTGLLVPFLSYEMSTNELTMRMLASSLSYDLHRLRQGDLMPGMERDLAVAGERLAGCSMLIDDNPPVTISGVRSSMRRLARRGEIGAIFIDYLQLMEGERNSRDPNRVQEIAQISRGLKRLASELGVPVVALSQLNRGLENRPNKRPMLSDLRESGSLEQDASVVAFLYRDSVYNPTAESDLAECIIAKQRNGPSGTVWLGYTAACAAFSTTERVGNAAQSGGFVAGSGNRPFTGSRDPF